jgi:hypothetical protein
MADLKNDPVITSIQDNAEDFSRELGRLASFVDVNYEAIVSKTVIDLFYAIVKRTPVDTGRAKANWFLGFDPNQEIGDHDLNDALEFGYDPNKGVTIWIYNNLEYIIPLEEGWSDQAPRGMVSLSLVEFNRFLKDAIKKLSSIAEPG